MAELPRTMVIYRGGVVAQTIEIPIDEELSEILSLQEEREIVVTALSELLYRMRSTATIVVTHSSMHPRLGQVLKRVAGVELASDVTELLLATYESAEECLFYVYPVSREGGALRFGPPHISHRPKPQFTDVFKSDTIS